MTKRGKVGIAALVLVACALAAWFFWKRDKPPEGFLVGFHAVDADRAILAVRANYEEGPSRGWVALVHKEKGLQWLRELPGVPVLSPYDGISLGGGVVTVRYDFGEYGEETLATAAYSLEKGERLWHAELPHTGHTSSSAGGPAASKELLIETTTIENGTSMIAFERASGKVRWKRRSALPESDLAGLRLVDGQLLVEPLFEAWFFRTSDGSPPIELSTQGPGCVVGNEYLVATLEAEELALVALDLGDLSRRRVIARPFALPALEGASQFVQVLACGTYRGLAVLTLARHRGHPPEGLEILAVDPSNGAVAWHLDLGPVHLGGSLPQGAIARSYRERYPLSGALTRFIPLFLDQFAEGDHTRLVLLDLEERRLVRQGPKRQELIHMAIFRVGTTLYLAGSYAGPYLVAAIDGTTGELTAAAHLMGPFEDALPFHVRDGTFWVYTSSWRQIDRLPWAALDAKTLAPLHNNGVEIRDARSAALELLGSPKDAG